MPNCPLCSNRAMSFWRKCILSPDASVRCASCGGQLTVPWAAVLAAAALAVGILAAVRLHFPWNVVGAFAGVGTYLVLERIVVPLIPRT